MTFATSSDGVRVRFDVRGEGSQSLLFLHGWAGSGRYFDQTLDSMDLTGLRAITLDLRGHGDSDKPENGYTDEQLGHDVLAVADAAGADAMIVVGFSMSGRFAQYVPLLAPERVRGLVLIAGCPAGPIPLPAETRRDWVARAGQAERLAEVTASFVMQPVDRAILDSYGREAAKACSTALDATLGLCIEQDFSGRVSEIDAPVLIVAGAHDPIFPPDVLRQAVAGPLRRARTVVLNSNHEIPREQPRELAAVIEAFVAGLGALEPS
jgi:pimeloyl-ACP methyl ester carboxylesterase